MYQFDRCIYIVANSYTSHLQDVTTVKLVLLACQLKIIIRVVLQPQHNN